MDLITSEDLGKTIRFLPSFAGNVIARVLFKMLDLDDVNNLYQQIEGLSGLESVDIIRNELGVSWHVRDEDLKNIPVTGNFIVVSNHPFGGIDGLAMLNIFASIRKDYRMLVNFLLTRIQPLQPFFLEVNPFENYRDVKSSLGGLKALLIHLKNGGCAGIFPAGEVSSFNLKEWGVTDREWQPSISDC